VTQLSAEASAVNLLRVSPDGFHVVLCLKTGHDCAPMPAQPPPSNSQPDSCPGHTIDLAMPAKAGVADSSWK